MELSSHMNRAPLRPPTHTHPAKALPDKAAGNREGKKGGWCVCVRWGGAQRGMRATVCTGQTGQSLPLNVQDLQMGSKTQGLNTVTVCVGLMFTHHTL